MEVTKIRSPSDPPLNLYYLEYYDNKDAKMTSTFITGGCVEECIAKFRSEGYEEEIYSITKSKCQHLIW